MTTHSKSYVESRHTTGVSVRGCYAASMLDCKGTLTAEHYISKNAIRIVSGHPTVTGTRSRAATPGIDNLVARVLCDRHNGLLSDLGIDGETGRLVSVLRSFFPGMPHSTYTDADEVFVFDGVQVQRVLLKMLCGITAGNVLQVESPAPKGWVPDPVWLDLLFNGTPWPEGWGLYIPVLSGGEFPNGDALILSRRVDAVGEIIGCDLVIGGLPFILLMGAGPTDWREAEFSHVLHQPERVVLHVHGRKKTLFFGWPDKRERVTINHRLHEVKLVPRKTLG